MDLGDQIPLVEENLMSQYPHCGVFVLRIALRNVDFLKEKDFWWIFDLFVIFDRVDKRRRTFC